MIHLHTYTHYGYYIYPKGYVKPQFMIFVELLKRGDMEAILEGKMLKVIINATVSNGTGNEMETCHIIMDGEKIREILPQSSKYPSDAQVIDAKDMLVLPGAIDPHVHFNTPGYTEREDFEMGTKSAAAGGVTTVIDMPDTSIPCVTDKKNLDAKLSVIEKMAVVDFALWGGVSGNIYREGNWQRSMRDLKQAGVVGFKSYLISGMAGFAHLLPLDLIEVMRFAKELGSIVGLHAEDRELVVSLQALMQTSGRRDPMAYYEARKDPAEENGARFGVAIARETGTSLHIVHVGSAGAGLAIAEAKKDGFDITGETCAHYLEFNCDDLEKFGSVLKTAPVVKTKKDNAKLWEFIGDGTLDFFASDHAPCSKADKETGSIWTDYGGISGTEVLLPYAFSEGYAKGRLTLAKLVEVTSKNAAKRFHLYPRKGEIAAGSDADLVLIDPKKKWKVKGEKFESKGKLTPFEGMEFTGKVVRTIVRGQTVYEDGKGVVAKAGYGKWIRVGTLF
jgi:allantoinase